VKVNLTGLFTEENYNDFETPDEHTHVIKLKWKGKRYTLTLTSLHDFKLVDQKGKTIDHTGYEQDIVLFLGRISLITPALESSMKEANLPFGYITMISFFMDELGRFIQEEEFLTTDNPPLNDKKKLMRALSIACKLLEENDFERKIKRALTA
jgi:hypothetical protein